MTILVTGAAGFIGSNFLKFLNDRNITDVYISDYLKNGKQYKNIVNCKYAEFITPGNITSNFLRQHITKVFHFGAISDTTEWDGELVLEKNYNFTTNLIENCIQNEILLSYSSSASVYGNGDGPLNLYAYSKYLIDGYVEKKLAINNKLKIQGFRYFNVYGPNEWHKDKQASPFYQFEQQALTTGEIKIFEGSANFKRDFVHVDTVCDIQYMMSLKALNGIYDLGSGKQRSFEDIANEIANKHGARVVEIPFPEKLKSCYQYNTISDMTWLSNL